jgi:hypothetical protein
LERFAPFFGVPIAIFFPQAQPKSRANAVLSATADLDDYDLEKVMLYGQFRKAQRPAKRRSPRVAPLISTDRHTDALR